MTSRSHSPLPPTIQCSKERLPVPGNSSLAVSPDTVKIFHDALLRTEGRDKVVKLLQYTSRLILLLSSAPSKRLRPFISQMSMTRKVLKLGHGIFPYCEITREQLTALALFRAIVEFVNDFWDDVYCLSRVGVLQSARLKMVSEEWANRFWMTGIIMDLYVLMKKRKVLAAKLGLPEARNSLSPDVQVFGPDEHEKGQEKLKTDLYWIDVSILKLLADFGFCCNYCPLLPNVDISD